MRKDFEFLPKVSGRGRYLGVNVGIIGDKGKYFGAWWGEGEFKAYIDGDESHPTLCGTGTEDYIGTAWGQGQYAHLYQGCPLADADNWQYTFYRYHLPDPVYFYKEIRVTMQQIGCWDPTSIKQIAESGHQLTLTGPEAKSLDMASATAENGYGLFERQDDWSSCCYFYLDKPENRLPALQEVNHRTYGLVALDETSFNGAQAPA